VALVAATTQAVTAADSAAGDRSIAVLPFVNMSGDTANDYFSDGISEEILNVLARTADLQVAARTSSFSFKGKNAEVPEIARQLQVRMVLEGSVRKQDDRVRITAQLIDAKKGFHVWSQTYDRKLSDIFAIQDEIAKAIGDELEVQIGGKGEAGKSSAGTRDLKAFDLYLRGTRCGSFVPRIRCGRRSTCLPRQSPPTRSSPRPTPERRWSTPSSRATAAAFPIPTATPRREISPSAGWRSTRRWPSPTSRWPRLPRTSGAGLRPTPCSATPSRSSRRSPRPTSGAERH
jgi:TolB-like protein